jgi:hypothetical protein
MVERVIGPIGGYYIASYACAMGELGRQFLGFARVCSVKPPDYWKAQAFAECSTTELLDSAETALECAERQARSHIARMNPAR